MHNAILNLPQSYPFLSLMPNIQKSNFAQRKYFHILATTPFFILSFFADTLIPRYVYVIIALVLIMYFLVWDWLRFKNKDNPEHAVHKLGHLLKEEESNRFASAIWGPVDLLLLALFFSKPTMVLTFIIGSYADPIAALIGKKYGKKKNKLGKTYVGSLAYFIAAFVLLSISNMILGSPVPILLLLALSVVATWAERSVRILDDNFFPPMLFAILLELSMRYLF